MVQDHSQEQGSSQVGGLPSTLLVSAAPLPALHPLQGSPQPPSPPAPLCSPFPPLTSRPSPDPRSTVFPVRPRSSSRAFATCWGPEGW